jgi:ketosteroid isomerase-like protein
MMFLDHETSVGSEEEALVSSAEENKALVRRFHEAYANADLDTLDELLASGFVDHSLQPGQEPGREGFMRSSAEEHDTFSDIVSASRN